MADDRLGRMRRRGSPRGRRRSHLGVMSGSSKEVFVFGGSKGTSGLERVQNGVWVSDIQSWGPGQTSSEKGGVSFDLCRLFRAFERR
jgi:hypothetical protein